MVGQMFTPQQRRNAVLMAALGVAAIVFAGCSTGSTTSKDGINLKTEDQLTICTHLPYAPFEFDKDGETVGFDVDLMDLVAKELDLKPEYFNTSFEGIQSGQALNSGDCDIAAAGMTITEERSKVIDFSDPYFDATQALLVPDRSTTKSLDDLSGKTLGVQTGTTGEIYAKENAPKDVEIKVFDDLGLQTTAVNTGRVDAGINDNGVLLDFAQKNKGTKVTAEFDTGEKYGFAVRKDGNDELLKVINDVIAKLQDDKTYDEIYAEWFGKKPRD